MKFIFRIILWNILAYITALPTFAQNPRLPWLRVVTQEDHMIDIDRSSLRFKQTGVVEVKIRTVLTGEESVPNQPSVKYKSRLDSMEYDLNSRKYHISATSFIDSTGTSVQESSVAKQVTWRSPSGITGRLLMSAINGLPPFGSWKVLTYRYGSGDSPSKDDPIELKALVGSLIVLETSSLRIAGKPECSELLFRSWDTKEEEVQERLGISLKSFGFYESKLDTVVMQCKKRGDNISPSYVLLSSEKRTVMLWNGVFLELERVMMPFPPIAMN